MAQSTALVVDSAASLPPEIEARPYVHVVPMRLNFGGQNFFDGQDLSTTEFYRRLQRGGPLPTTSAPSPDAFLECFREAARRAESIVCLTVSPSFSASYNAALSAVKAARAAFPGVPTALVDSQSAAGGQALVATAAVRAIEAGGSHAEVLGEMEAVAPRVTLFAFVDTLHYLWKGGRVPRVVYAGASLLQIKPMLEMSRGRVRTVGRPRTRRRATRRLMEAVVAQTRGRPVHASVVHADALEEAMDLQAALRDALNCVELFVSEFSPVMGAHTGPGLLGVAFWAE